MRLAPAVGVNPRSAGIDKIPALWYTPSMLATKDQEFMTENLVLANDALVNVITVLESYPELSAQHLLITLIHREIFRTSRFLNLQESVDN